MKRKFELVEPDNALSGYFLYLKEVIPRPGLEPANSILYAYPRNQRMAKHLVDKTGSPVACQKNAVKN